MKKDNIQEYLTSQGIALDVSDLHSSPYYRKLLRDKGCSLYDLYNRFGMFDPYAQFHADQNTAQDAVCLHSHNYYELIYCLQTTGISYLVGSERFSPQSGDLICIMPGISHRPVFSEAMTGSFQRIILNLDCDFVAETFQRYGSETPKFLFSTVLIRPHRDLSSQLRLLFDSGTQLSQLSGSQFEKISLVLKILSCIERSVRDEKSRIAPSNREDLLDRLIKYIDTSFSQKLTLQSVADHFFVSPSTISHLFSEKMQESFYQFVQQRRLAESQRLILRGLPLEQVSINVGFPNYQNFYRSFKRAYGLSPKEYRLLFQK